MYLIVTRAFPPELGGMQSLMWGLSKEMSKNFMIKVFADYQENHKEFDSKENFSIERVGGIKFLRKIRKAQLINEFLKENKVQGIIADHWKSLELIKTDKKKYCLIHGKEINHPKGSSLNKRVIKVLNNVEKVIANSEYTKNLAIDNGVSKNKVIVINPGIDPVQEVNKKSLEKVESLLKVKTPRLITVSRFDKRKNHEKVIMALRNLKQKYPDIVYICIGDGDEAKNIKDLVKELDLSSQVMF
ncbi:glycosyltransferase, partial [Candidatus Pelagibacter sp.]|nr:glycosyltransferase [Candidatus Pelagibacter sp.]